MHILLVRPCPELRVARALEKGFLHLEPLDLEIVAGGVPPEHEVTILDLSLEDAPIDTFRRRMDEIRPDITGFTGFSSHARQVRELTEIAKAVHPRTLTVVGGIHATIASADYKTDAIDIIVRGEGGTTFRELVRRVAAGDSPAFGEAVLSTTDPEFDSLVAKPPPPYPSFDEIPKPRRDLVDRKRYFSVWTSTSTRKLDTMFPVVATVRTSVGCAFNCSFCVVHHLMNGKYVQRTPEDVADELESLEEKNIYFVDDEMFLNTDRMKRLAGLLIERGIRKNYYSWARSDTIVKNPDLFKLWKEAGLGTLYIGLEAMVDSRLDDYHKRIKADTNREAVRVLRDIGITLHGCFIVNPDFSVDDFRMLENEVMNVCPAEVTFTVLSPSPGTAFWEEQKDNFICDPYYFYDCMHTLLPTRLPLKLFYAHFARLTSIALRANPLRMHRIKVPFRDLLRAIVGGTKYIFALRSMYKDYEQYPPT